MSKTNGAKPSISSIKARDVATTTEYDVFKRLPGNRSVDPLHVANLVKAMEEEYIFSPILVNQEFEVLDGQHRLEAHKRLGLPVPFFWGEVGDLSTVQRMNNSQKGWTNDDYANSYIEKGIQDYVTYKWFKDSFKMPHMICVILLNGGEQRGLSKLFKGGEFKVKNLELAKQKAAVLSTLSKYFTHWKDAGFLRALTTAMNKKGFDIQQFIHKVAMNSTMLVPCVSTDQYLQLIEEIYNFRSTKKIPVRHAMDDPDSKWRG